MNYFNTVTGEYPVTERSIRESNPNTSFSTPFIAPEEYSFVFPAPQPECDAVLEAVREITPVLTVKGHYEQTWEVYQKYTKAADKNVAKTIHLEVQKVLKKNAVNQKRKESESIGLLYTFPDGIGTIQTSDEDIRNVLAVTTTALVLNSQGVVDSVIKFRDLENTIHNLTPSEAITMGLAVQSFISNTYQESWSKKAAIDAATTILKLNGLVL